MFTLMRDIEEKDQTTWQITIYTNRPGENVVQRHKTIKSDVVREQHATKYIQICWTAD